ncbi:MAG TPA: hypothetical protein VM487_25455 [Phycisphaerae bacterium]|nr:hypothetical protein [Phycisphaerae bacterium]
MIGPWVAAIDPKAASPVLAIVRGPEVVAVVHLKRTEEGYYMDTKMEWLRGKSEPDSRPQ